MEAAIIILGIIVSYFVFIGITYLLAHLIFPKIDIEELDLDFEGIAEFKNGVKKLKQKIYQRHGYPAKLKTKHSTLQVR